MTWTGVVGGLRIPPWIRDRWRALPRLAQVFIVLTAIDIVGRLVGLVAPRLALDAPLTSLASLVSHDLVILFPVILVLRRRDAAAVAPWILAGAVVLAATELVDVPLRFLVADVTRGASVAPALVLGMVRVLLTAGGWIAVGLGLLRLTTVEPSEFVAGLANLVAAAIVGGTVLSYLALGGSNGGFGDHFENELYDVNQLLAATVSPFAWAFALRAAIRGYDDVTRPAIAGRVAAVAGALAALAGTVLAVLAIGLLATSTPIVHLNAPFRTLLQSGGLSMITWLGTAGATALLVVAFGLGLADPHARYVLPEDTGSAILEP